MKHEPPVTEDILEVIESFLTPSYPEVLNSLSAIELCLVSHVCISLTIFKSTVKLCSIFF